MTKMVTKPRQPTKAHLTRASHDMRSGSPALRREAAEVMSLAARKAKKR